MQAHPFWRRRFVVAFLVAAAALTLGACQGEIGNPGGTAGTGSTTDETADTSDPNDTNTDVSTEPTFSPPTFTCDDGLDPGESDLRRLSFVQYRNTIATLGERYIGDGGAMAAIDTQVTRTPEDAPAPSLQVRGTAFDKLDQSMTQQHVNNSFDVARAFAAEATGGNTRLERLMGPCASDGDPSNDVACVEDFIRDFGMHAFRRPLIDDEVSYFRDEVYADGGVAGDLLPEGVHDVVVVMLTSPFFMYHFEDRGTDIDGRDDFFELDGYGRAARLSYHFWQTMPDEALFAAAADGSIMTEAGYEAQVSRLFDDPRTRFALEDFYHQWLLLEEAAQPHLLAGTPRYSAFADGVVPSTELHDAMIDDILDLTLFHSYTAPGSLDDLLRSGRSFARSPELAALYGVEPWNGSDDHVVEFADEARTGLITRAAMVANTESTTSPIHKGVIIRRQLLCDELPPPIDNVPTDPGLTPPFSRREFTAALTESTDACLDCHRLINGLGYATENFDSLARVRTEEPYWLEDGTLIGTSPIDTSSQPHILGLDDDRTFADAREVSDALLESGKVHACMARHYFRYAHGRVENLTADGCALESLREQLMNGGSLRDALRDIALDPSFLSRKRGPDTAP